ncbi:CBO0543 family protein [Neobacillus sp. D3-1R]|uniref:CBO0543 family protein n=1 Tax=Neobacillus sp. D3-1R TaxID=3445778 RepID=UPI003FA1971E
MSTIEKLDKLTKETHEIVKQIIDLWSQEVIFTWRWWFGVILTVLTWLLWFKFHKKESRYRLLLAGFFVMTVSVSLDAIGVQLGLWSYRYEVFPLIPAYLPYDLALMPVVIMSLIQFKPHISTFKKAIIFGLLTSFIGEPLIVWIDIYKPLHWKFFYSFPIYMAIYLIAEWFISRRKFEDLNK